MTRRPSILDVLAVARLTRLATRDTLTEPLRDRIRKHGLARMGGDVGSDAGQKVAGRWGDDVAWSGGPVGYLVSCPWCSAPYVAAGWLLLCRLAPDLSGRLALWLAFSDVSARLASRD